MDDNNLKAALEWIREQLQNDTRAVARNILAHLDGEPERLATKAEEVREACASAVARTAGTQPGCEVSTALASIRAVPLTATPLADELERSRQETARMVERAERAEAQVATERAHVVEYLRSWAHYMVADRIERGEHEEDGNG